MIKENKKCAVVYEIVISLLALISVVLVCLDLLSIISISTQPYKFIDLTILCIFWIDYVSRLYLSKNKINFARRNILDLIAIIPFNEVFALFRITRIFRIARLTRLTKATRLIRAFSFVGVFNKRMNKFLKTNGFIYMLYASGILILVSSFLMSFIEKQSFVDALWWSMVTCTTVGYGDISPSTGLGRIIAVLLMIFGIGFIGMLTGTITTYFTNKLNFTDEPKETTSLNDIISTLDDIQKEDLLQMAKLIKEDKIILSITEKE